MDSTSVDLPVPDYMKSLTKDVRGLRIGVPKEYFIKVKVSIDDLIGKIKNLVASPGGVAETVSTATQV